MQFISSTNISSFDPATDPLRRERVSLSNSERESYCFWLYSVLFCANRNWPKLWHVQMFMMIIVTMVKKAIVANWYLELWSKLGSDICIHFIIVSQLYSQWISAISVTPGSALWELWIPVQPQLWWKRNISSILKNRLILYSLFHPPPLFSGTNLLFITLD